MNVLWLDDDTVPEVINVDGIRITKVQSCEQAALCLEEALPDWVLVDFIVPQESWGNGLLYRVPGLRFITDVTSRYKDKVRVAAYGRGVLPSWRKVARDNGAEQVFEKREIAFHDVLRELRSARES
jgi:hypothetical protein